MAVGAGNAILARMDVVTEKNRLSWTAQTGGIGDDGGRVRLRALRRLLGGGGERIQTENRVPDRQPIASVRHLRVGLDGETVWLLRGNDCVGVRMYG
jgi:hypothetical protein